MGDPVSLWMSLTNWALIVAFTHVLCAFCIMWRDVTTYTEALLGFLGSMGCVAWCSFL